MRIARSAAAAVASLTSVVALVAASMLICAGGAAAAPGPRLVLEPDAFVQLDGYRYDAATPYAAGQNRGVEAIAVGGRVGAPVGGTVRFAGQVAGRGVVTVASRMRGRDVVVTMTGLDRVDRRVGDRVATGDRIGRATRVHVGMYDPQQRSTYFPVFVAARAAAVGGADASVREPVSTSIAGTLARLVAGDDSWSGASLDPDGPTGPGPIRALGLGSDQTGRGGLRFDGVRASPVGAAARLAVELADVVSAAARGSLQPAVSALARTPDANGVSDPAARSDLGNAVGAGRPSRGGTTGGAQDGTSEPASPEARSWRGASRAVVDGASLAIGPRMPDARGDAGGVTAVGVTGGGGADGDGDRPELFVRPTAPEQGGEATDRDDARAPGGVGRSVPNGRGHGTVVERLGLPALLVAASAAGSMAWRRRRRSGRVAPTSLPIGAPLPVLVPAPVERARPRLPGTRAWTGLESGTTPDTPRAPAARVPTPKQRTRA